MRRSTCSSRAESGRWRLSQIRRRRFFPGGEGFRNFAAAGSSHREEEVFLDLSSPAFWLRRVEAHTVLRCRFGTRSLWVLVSSCFYFCGICALDMVDTVVARVRVEEVLGRCR